MKLQLSRYHATKQARTAVLLAMAAACGATFLTRDRSGYGPLPALPPPTNSTQTPNTPDEAAATSAGGVSSAGSIGANELPANALPANAAIKQAAEQPAAASSDVESGREVFLKSCAACHGVKAQGLPHQGLDLRTSKFVAGRSDDELLAFLKMGRLPGDPRTVTNLFMPPRGGNMGLGDEQLKQIVSFLRKVQEDAAQKAAAE